MSPNLRIALNASVTYGRTLLRIGLGIFTSRWLLQSLGEVDYGLMGVVGSLIVFITFLNSVASGACSRFFAFSIGKKDVEDLTRWFNAALSVHVILPLVLIAIGWPIGEWAIDNWVKIPPDRLATAHWVFRFSLLAAFWGMASTPYMAMYTATQNIAERTLWEVALVIANFGFIYWLTTYKGDAWFVYSAFGVLLGIILGLGQIIRARIRFPGCVIVFKYWGDWSRLRKMLSYSCWTLFGSLGYLARSQLPAIILNQYFPPMQFKYVNASYQVGGALASYTSTFSSSLMGAFSPQITTLEGAGDRAGMVRTAFRASKFGVFMTLLVAIPVALEVDYLLVLWLKTPPKLAGAFCLLVILQTVLDHLTFGHMTGILAGGRIKWYQMTTGSLCMCCVPIAWLVLALGGSPLSVSWVIAGCMAACSVARLFFGRVLLGIRILDWARDVFVPIMVISSLSFLLGCSVHLLWHEVGFLRMVVTSAITSASMIMLSWWFLFDGQERGVLIRAVKNIVLKRSV